MKENKKGDKNKLYFLPQPQVNEAIQLYEGRKKTQQKEVVVAFP